MSSGIRPQHCNSVVNYIISECLFVFFIIIYHSLLIKKKLLFLYLTDCKSALGLEDLRIQDSQLTAQSHYESLSIGGGKAVDTEPKCGRLNKNSCAWCAPHGNGQYLQVDLGRNFTITGIATQGFEALSDYYVRKYKVFHSRNGHSWISIFPVSILLTFREINNSDNDNTSGNIYSDINNNFR